MRGMAAVTSLFDNVAALAKRGPDFLRDAQVFSLNAHSLKPDGMAAFPELGQLLGMAFPTLIGENHGFGPISSFVVSMTGDAVYPLLGMLGFHPGLEEAGGPFDMAAHAESRINSIFRFFRRRDRAGDQSQAEQDESEPFKPAFHEWSPPSFST